VGAKKNLYLSLQKHPLRRKGRIDIRSGPQSLTNSIHFRKPEPGPNPVRRKHRFADVLVPYRFTGWLCQVGVRLTCVRIQRDTDDFPLRIDGAGGDEIQGCGTGDQSIEVYQLAVLANECAGDAEIRVRGNTDDLSLIIDAEPHAVGVIVYRIIDRAQILHLTGRRPEKCMGGLVSCKI